MRYCPIPHNLVCFRLVASIAHGEGENNFTQLELIHLRPCMVPLNHNVKLSNVSVMIVG